jgi:hypothetical protein
VSIIIDIVYILFIPFHNKTMIYHKEYFFPVRISRYPSVSAQFWAGQPIVNCHPVMRVTSSRRTITGEGNCFTSSSLTCSVVMVDGMKMRWRDLLVNVQCFDGVCSVFLRGSGGGGGGGGCE